LCAPSRGTVRRVSRAASRAWKGERSSGEAPVKSIRRRATWARFSPRIWANLHAMAAFLAANRGELAGHGAIENAMAFAQQPVFTVSPRLKLGLAWQNVSSGN